MDKTFKIQTQRFVEENLARFNIPSGAEGLKITIFPMRKRISSSTERPSGTIILEYSAAGKKTERRHIWGKRGSDAKDNFEKINYFYESLGGSSLNAKMPVPFCADEHGGTVFISKVFGRNLTSVAVERTILNFGRQPKSLQNLLFNIGWWLSAYHLTMGKDIVIKASFGEMLEELAISVEKDLLLSTEEKDIFVRNIVQLEKKLSGCMISVTRPHNDFIMRNIIIEKNDDFKIIDWDKAVIWPDSTAISTKWYDITKFIINLKSLLRFYPLVAERQIDFLAEAFLKGYFHRERIKPGPEEKAILWTYSLAFYVGLVGDRPVYDDYRRRLCFRFIGRFREMMVSESINMLKM